MIHHILILTRYYSIILANINKSGISYPIHIVLYEHNYILWSQAMHNFLKDMRL